MDVDFFRDTQGSIGYISSRGESGWFLEIKVLSDGDLVDETGRYDLSQDLELVFESVLQSS